MLIDNLHWVFEKWIICWKCFVSFSKSHQLFLTKPRKKESPLKKKVFCFNSLYPETQKKKKFQSAESQKVETSSNKWSRSRNFRKYGPSRISSPKVWTAAEIFLKSWNYTFSSSGQGLSRVQEKSWNLFQEDGNCRKCPIFAVDFLKKNWPRRSSPNSRVDDTLELISGARKAARRDNFSKHCWFSVNFSKQVSFSEPPYTFEIVTCIIEYRSNCVILKVVVRWNCWSGILGLQQTECMHRKEGLYEEVTIDGFVQVQSIWVFCSFIFYF